VEELQKMQFGRVLRQLEVQVILSELRVKPVMQAEQVVMDEQALQ